DIARKCRLQRSLLLYAIDFTGRNGTRRSRGGVNCMCLDHYIGPQPFERLGADPVDPPKFVNRLEWAPLTRFDDPVGLRWSDSRQLLQFLQGGIVEINGTF